jgi:uncharacterized protein
VGALNAIWLVMAGFGGGIAGSTAGLASLVSYPALLAVGLAPVTANVSNTVALVFSSVGSVSGSRPELRGQRARTRRLAFVALGGGITGAILLLATPSSAFAKVVPWLIGLASLAILAPRHLALPAPSPAEPGCGVPPDHHHRSPVALGVGIYLVAVYGGYFGAGAGVLMLSLLLLTSDETLPRSNAIKNVLLGLANAVAAFAFVLFGPVQWSAVVPLAVGFLIGGRLGPPIVRRVPAGPLRVAIACAGLGLALHLGLDAYG